MRSGSDQSAINATQTTGQLGYLQHALRLRGKHYQAFFLVWGRAGSVEERCTGVWLVGQGVFQKALRQGRRQQSKEGFCLFFVYKPKFIIFIIIILCNN